MYIHFALKDRRWERRRCNWHCDLLIFKWILPVRRFGTKVHWWSIRPSDVGVMVCEALGRDWEHHYTHKPPFPLSSSTIITTVTSTTTFSLITIPSPPLQCTGSPGPFEASVKPPWVKKNIPVVSEKLADWCSRLKVAARLSSWSSYQE